MSTIFSSADRVNAVIKIRRGPDSDRTSNIYDSGELIYTTDKKRVYVGDGGNSSGTYGGNIVGNKAWITDSFSKLNNIEIGDTVYRTDTSAYYVLTGSAYVLESSYILIGGNEIITQNISNGKVPKATKSTLGVIKVGADLDIAVDGTLNLPKATNAILGGVKVGTGLSAATDGTLSVTGIGGGSTYTLSAATISTLGGVIVGKGLSADNTGKLSLSAIPETANLGQVLSWNGSKWVATDPSTIGGGGGGGDAIPIGSVMYFAASSIPLGYLECDGRAVNRSYYSDLDSVIYCGDVNNANVNTIFGYRCTLATSPATTRNTLGQYIVLPDLRGEFIRGWDHITSDNRPVKIDTDRKFGSYQTDGIKDHSHNLNTNALYSTNDQTPNSPVKMLFGDGVLRSGDGAQLGDSSLNNQQYIGSVSGTTSTETRPHNIALMACIKAVKTGAPSVINYIPKPATATNGQVLTYQYSTNSWVASGAPLPKSGKEIYAWVKFTETSTRGIFDIVGYNVSNITKSTPTGREIHFTTPINSEYIVIANAKHSDTALNVFGNNYAAEGVVNNSTSCYVNYYPANTKNFYFNVIIIA